jgi:predicted NodU family carbamoyl transferase
LNILGIHAFTGPSAACLVREGRVVAAAREELFTRSAQDASFPKNAIAYCLRAAKLGPSALHAVAWCGRPEEALAQHIARALAFAKGYPIFRRSVIGWPDGFFDAETLLFRELGAEVRVCFLEETLSHAAAAFYASPFEEAAILALGSGFEDPAVILAKGSGTAIEVTDMTVPAGKENSRNVGGDSAHGQRGDSPSFEQLTAHARRALDRARSKSLVLAGPLDWKSLGPRLCRSAMAGQFWAHPAANGGACAAGAALLLSAREGIAPTRPVESSDRPDPAWSYGPGYNSHQIRTFLRSRDVHTDELETEDLHARVATLLSEKKRVGWFQGRLDLGASPVTSRSVLTTELVEGEEHSIDAGSRRGLDQVSRMLQERGGHPSLYASPLARPGEPLACTPSDAYDCFAPLSLDAIAMGPYLVTREMARDPIDSLPPEPARANSQSKITDEFAAFLIWLKLLPSIVLRRPHPQSVSAARAAKTWLAARRVFQRAHRPGS